jgi:general secretion pathway protein F
MSFLIAAFIIIGSSFFLAPYVMESDLIQAAGDAVDVDWVFVTADVVAYLMLVVTVAFLFLLILAYVVKPLAPSFADKLILRIPIYRDLVLAQGHYTVFYGMGLLVRSGVRMEDTLRLAKESAPPGEVAEDMSRALHAVRHGKPWPQAMHHLHPTDRAALSTSQDREQVSDSIDAVANQYKENYTQRVQQVVPVLQMISALFMTIGGALIFGMIILPMLQMTKGVLM